MGEETMFPPRKVLITAEETNRRLGHENLGFLSETHGFMPSTPPLLHLPPAYHVWDQAAAALPDLYRNLAVRRELADLPLLDASAASLPDRYLLRASVNLSAFAHTYHYSEPNPPDELPVCFQRPWEQVARRLGRPGPHISLVDQCLYNWQWINPESIGQLSVENLKLLVPAWGTETERIFWMSILELVAESAPLVGAVVRAQEAVLYDDVDALICELIRVSDCVTHLGQISFMKTNPNSYSDSYVDPVVWAKTVARSAVPLRPGIAGPSGSAVPTMHVLDAFFERVSYATHAGHDTRIHQAWSLKHWEEFVAAVAKTSVSDYVKQKQNRRLTGIFRDALQTYAGELGLLDRHRLKGHGYIDTAFKVGRSVTIGGYRYRFQDRTWDHAAHDLDQSRLERYARLGSTFYHLVPLQRGQSLGSGADEQAHQIVFQLAGLGLRYQPGDRVALLPENSDELVAKTLQALRARGDEPIQLNAVWRAAMALRDGYAGVQVLALRTLLKFGCIRPVERAVAKTLYAITYNEKLKQILAARAEDQWELWDLLNLLAAGGFNPRSLWKAQPGDRQHLCSIVPPETYRFYSIASALGEGQSECAELHLTVGHLHYQTKETAVSAPAQRHGTGSTFLHQASSAATAQRNVALRVVHPLRFSLPQDETRPIVMFAGGAGIAPFRGFLQARAKQTNAGENWLFFGTRTRADFYYQQEIEQLAAHGQVQVRMAFSREDVEARFVGGDEGGRFVFAPSHRHRIDEEMLHPENARLLWDLLRSRAEGGREGVFYVCGQTSFAKTVMEAIKTILERFAEGPEESRAQAARERLYRLVGQERYLQDIFTTYSGPQTEQRQRYDASEVVLHNNDEEGYWLIIDGRVYDMSEFAHLHPGGFKIIRAYAGMDATHAYQKVGHHGSPEIAAMLGLYEIGVVRRLDFGAAWGAVIGPQGLTVVTLEEVYRTWIRALYTLVELENALHNDFSVRTEVLTHDETRGAPVYSPFKLQQLIRSQERFLSEYMPEILGENLADLWAMVSGLCGEQTQVNWLKTALAASQQSQTAQQVGGLDKAIMARLKATLQEHPTPDIALLQPVIDGSERCEAEAKRLLCELRLALRSGLQVFERYEQNTITLGSHQLMAALQALPAVLTGYYTRLATAAPAHITSRLTNGAPKITQSAPVAAPVADPVQFRCPFHAG